MSRRFLLDEMLGPRVAEQLRAKGVDAVALVEEPSHRGLPDAEVLELATATDRVVVTRNVVDFLRLDQQWRAAGRAHAGILLVPQASFPHDRAFVGAVVTALAAHEVVPSACAFLARR